MELSDAQAASLGQVYKATTRDGREVAVKAQRQRRNVLGARRGAAFTPRVLRSSGRTP